MTPSICTAPSIASPATDPRDSSSWGIRKTSASIDFVEIEVALGRTTTFAAVQRCVDTALGRLLLKPTFVSPTNLVGYGASQTFKFVVHDPTSARLEMLLAALDNAFALLSSPKILTLEVAVDFYPALGATRKDLDTLARQIAERLHAPGAAVRQYGEATGFRALSLRHTEDRMRDGCTVYFGHRYADLMYRVYPKILDQGIALPLEEFRARCEVRLTGPELSSRGIVNLDSLRGCNFREKLAGLFRFRRQRDGAAGFADNSLRGVVAKRRGIVEGRGMRAFDGVEVRRGRRVRKYSAITQADSSLTARIGKSLDRLTRRFT